MPDEPRVFTDPRDVGTCDRCGSPTIRREGLRQPGDVVTYWKCSKCDAGLKGFLRNTVTCVIVSGVLLGLTGLGINLISRPFESDFANFVAGAVGFVLLVILLIIGRKM